MTEAVLRLKKEELFSEDPHYSLVDIPDTFSSLREYLNSYKDHVLENFRVELFRGACEAGSHTNKFHEINVKVREKDKRMDFKENTHLAHGDVVLVSDAPIGDVTDPWADCGWAQISGTKDEGRMTCEYYACEFVKGGEATLHFCVIGTVIPSNRILASLSNHEKDRLSPLLLSQLLGNRDVDLPVAAEPQLLDTAQLNASQIEAIKKATQACFTGGFSLIHGT